MSSFSIMIALLVSFGTVEARPGNSYGDGLDKKRDEVVNLFRSRTDPKIKGVTWAEYDNLLVGVVMDGTSHKDIAEYMCQVVIDYGFSGKQITVQVVDINELLKTQGGWVYLATAKCK